MPTIVTYTDSQPPLNQFPQRIISPTQSGSCCSSDMEDLETVHRDERFEYAYRRCRTCGFTVRMIIRPVPDQERIAAVQKLFSTIIGRAFSSL
jgi:hypothetical protein